MTRVAKKPSGIIRLGGRIDAEIAPLVAALRARGADTLASCCGHGRERAYIDFAVQGLDGLRSFVVETGRVQDAMPAVVIDLALTYERDVATACDFEVFPDWIMLSMTIEDVDRAGPSKARLAQVAKAYAKPNPKTRKRK